MTRVARGISVMSKEWVDLQFSIAIIYEEDFWVFLIFVASHKTRDPPLQLCDAMVKERTSNPNKSSMEILAQISNLQHGTSSTDTLATCNDINWKSYLDWYKTPTTQNANDLSWLVRREPHRFIAHSSTYTVSNFSIINYTNSIKLAPSSVFIRRATKIPTAPMPRVIMMFLAIWNFVKLHLVSSLIPWRKTLAQP